MGHLFSEEKKSPADKTSLRFHSNPAWLQQSQTNLSQKTAVPPAATYQRLGTLFQDIAYILRHISNIYAVCLLYSKAFKIHTQTQKKKKKKDNLPHNIFLAVTTFYYNSFAVPGQS